MVAIGAFPIAKLGGLLLKQVSKPIANAIKHQAKSSPVFSRYVCMPPARFYNWCETKSKMWVLHLGKPVNITVLNDEMAIELGANLLGETIVFLVAAGVVLVEYNRSSKKEAAKEEAKRREIEQLQDTLRELFIQTEEQAAHIRELSRKLGDLEHGPLEPASYFTVKYSKGLVEHTNKSVLPPLRKPTGPGSKQRIWVETRVVQKPWVPKKEDEPKRSPPSSSPPQIQRKNLDIMEPQATLDNYNMMNNSVYHAVNNAYGAQQNEHPAMGLISKAVNQIENEFWVDTETNRKCGVVTQALNHIYHNVYRLPITFY